MGLCGWIVFGFIAGLVARALMPGKQALGFVGTTLLGIAGSFVGGMIATVIFGVGWRVVHPAGFIGAVIGALVLLAIGQALKHR